jgi:hypothetical protein
MAKRRRLLLLLLLGAICSMSVVVAIAEASSPVTASPVGNSSFALSTTSALPAPLMDALRASLPSGPDAVLGPKLSANGATASGFQGNPAGCDVYANNVHLSTDLAGAASADGFVQCRLPLADWIQVTIGLFRLSNGSWLPVGDRNGVPAIGYSPKNIKITQTSKENPARCGAGYLNMALGQALIGGLEYDGTVINPTTGTTKVC